MRLRLTSRPNGGPEGSARDCTEIVALAGILELRKITAQMVADHKSARALFERLGFHVEALLPDWVEDRDRHCRDLLLMAYDVRRPREHAPT